MEIWIVLAGDRHGGPDVLAFSSKDAAVQHARNRAGHDGIAGDELTDAMRAAGWVAHLPISEEGDRVTVIRRTVDA